ncbi:MAG: DNA/RNA non-specific endonuclease [Bacteroidales bacterium]|nr:DNA/RNA non-specific endonuclease [Bacteroidales bacterium]
MGKNQHDNAIPSSYNDLRHAPKPHRHHHRGRKFFFAFLIIALIAIVAIYFFNPQLFNQLVENQQEYYEQRQRADSLEMVRRDTTTTLPTATEQKKRNDKTSTPTKKEKNDGYTTSTTTSTTTSSTKTDKPAKNTKQDSEYTSTSTKTSDSGYTQTQTKVRQPQAVGNNQIIEHKAYKLSYNEQYEQADWVFYLLTKARVNGEVPRTGDFCEDPYVKTQTALKSDYSNSNYDRGHLCPSADVRDDLDAQIETFYMSNMSPQVPDFNRGIWKDLEEQTRRWVQKHDSIYIVTGPVLKGRLTRIGTQTRVSVPRYFYKILYSPRDKGHMIAYLMPNKNCKGSPNDYIVSVDSVESFTGLKFFPKIKNEKSLKSKVGEVAWWKN